jgi:methyl-accepting chemotaxis protein
MKRCIVIALVILGGCSRPELMNLATDWSAHHIDVSGIDFTTAALNPALYKNIIADPESSPEWSGPFALPAAVTMERKKQLCLLKKETVIPSSLKGKNLALFIGKVWDTSETWLNGVKIGSSGRDYPAFHSDWNVAVYHHIPEGLINFDEKNTIIIRQFSDQQLNFNGEPFIGEEHEVRSFTFKMRFMAEYLIMALGVMTLLSGIAMVAAHFIGREKSKVNLNFGAMSILWFILTSHFWLPDFSPLSWRMHDNIFYVLVGLLIVWIYMSLEEVTQQKFKIARIIVAVIFAMQVGLAMTSTVNDPITGWRFDVMGPIGLIVQLLWGFVLIKGILKGSAEAKILMIGYGIFFVTLIHDALMMNRIIMSYAFMTNIAYPGFILSFAIISIRRISILNSELIVTKSEIEIKNERLGDVIKNVIESTDELISISIMVNESSSNLNNEMSLQSDSLQTTSATVEQITASISSIADNAREQDWLVKKSKTLLDDYISSINQITGAAKEASKLGSLSREQSGSVTDKLTLVTEGMQKIKESTSEIEQIADMINEIAEKTNLLSLNAAIEAARAGDSGRGFAVVADEIGKLADSSVEQAKTIQKIIQGIVTDIEAENRLINESTESILAVKGAANNVNDAVNAIMQLCSGQDKLTELIQKNMDDMNKGSSEISTSTVEQQTAMNGVMETINSLNEVVEQVNRSTASMVEISERLSHRIALLNKIVIDH